MTLFEFIYYTHAAQLRERRGSSSVLTGLHIKHKMMNVSIWKWVQVYSIYVDVCLFVRSEMCVLHVLFIRSSYFFQSGIYFIIRGF